VIDDFKNKIVIQYSKEEPKIEMIGEVEHQEPTVRQSTNDAVDIHIIYVYIYIYIMLCIKSHCRKQLSTCEYYYKRWRVTYLHV